ncbi:hypothetical protein ABM34_10545 [Companilactobacillus ginsenosidimutans]|uniref:Acyltransferase 3 domain-containing protein n=2 Tax=Companilactobacillus ginsenosidimutans TaxID=1007676 RepID=A0A0H4QHQ7_9LACO|nr:hypothetical protein ABM34_10545 [Companilactobacillus ginsenosidimutans]
MSHSLAETLNQNRFSFDWHVKNIFLGTVSPAVGIFFMVSGALILSSTKTDNIGYLFKHRLVKIMVPFLIWSGISILVMMQLDGNVSWGMWLHRMLLLYNRFPIIPFWFLYPLIGFYLLSPILKAFVDKASMRTLDYAIILWFVTNICLPFIAQLLPKKFGIYFTYIPNSNLIILGQTIGYFLLGYRLDKTPIKPHTFQSNVVATLLLLAITIILNYENLLYHWHIPVIGYAPSIFAVILAMEIFLMVKKWDYYHPLTRSRRRRVTLLSTMSYGVYLTHGMVIQIIEEAFHIDNFFLVFLLTSVICLVFTYAVSKIPKARFFLLGMD